MYSRFGTVVFHSRASKHLPQKTIAGRAGIDSSYLASIERGRRPPPQRQIVDRILAALEMSDAERATAIAAAALDRLEPAIRDAEGDLPGAAVLVRLCSALPHLSHSKLTVLADVISVLADQLPREEKMS
jgi:HTH-type transcriptional regulator, competence development regulator